MCRPCAIALRQTASSAVDRRVELSRRVELAPLHGKERCPSEVAAPRNSCPFARGHPPGVSIRPRADVPEGCLDVGTAG